MVLSNHFKSYMVFNNLIKNTNIINGFSVKINQTWLSFHSSYIFHSSYTFTSTKCHYGLQNVERHLKTFLTRKNGFVMQFKTFFVSKMRRNLSRN